MRLLKRLLPGQSPGARISGRSLKSVKPGPSASVPADRRDGRGDAAGRSYREDESKPGVARRPAQAQRPSRGGVQRHDHAVLRDDLARRSRFRPSPLICSDTHPAVRGDDPHRPPGPPTSCSHRRRSARRSGPRPAPARSRAVTVTTSPSGARRRLADQERLLPARTDVYARREGRPRVERHGRSAPRPARPAAPGRARSGLTVIVRSASLLAAISRSSRGSSASAARTGRRSPPPAPAPRPRRTRGPDGASGR